MHSIVQTTFELLGESFLRKQAEFLEERCVNLGNYILKNKGTVRSTAKEFGISKSTVHKDLTERLCELNHGLYLEVKTILDLNKKERHIRGGLATKEKYLHMPKKS